MSCALALLPPFNGPQFRKYSGVADIRLDAVHLYLNAETEEAWWDLYPGFTSEHLQLVTLWARQGGYIPKWEDLEGVEELEDGRIRQWLVQEFYDEEMEYELEAAS